MNWKGQIVMTFQDEQEFVFKAKGVFVALDQADAPLEPTGQKVIQGTI